MIDEIATDLLTDVALHAGLGALSNVIVIR